MSKVVQFPAEILSTPSEAVEDFSQVSNHIMGMMVLCKSKKRPAVGLAAPQIGVPLRFFVTWRNDCLKYYINPIIVHSSETYVTKDESCISFNKKLKYPISRSCSVIVKYQTLDERWHEATFEDHHARIMQHEIDHLDGITMFDRWKEQQ